VINSFSFKPLQSKWHNIITLSYLLIGLAVTKSFNQVIPGWINVLFAAPLILAVPYEIGKVFMYLISKVNLWMISKERAAVKFLVCWFAGLAAITLIAGVLQVLGVFYLLLAIVPGLLFVELLIDLSDFDFQISGFPRQKLYSIVISAIIGVLPVLITIPFLPYPLFGLNHDSARAIIQPVTLATENYHLMLDARIPEVILLAIPSYFLNADPLGLLWVSRFILAMVFGCGIFLFVQDKIRDFRFSMVAVLFASLIMSGGADPTGMLFFDIPAQQFKGTTVLYAMFPFALLLVDRNSLNSKNYAKGMAKVVTAVGIASVLVYLLFLTEDRMFALPNGSLVFTAKPLMLLIVFLTTLVAGNALFKSVERKVEFTLLYLYSFVAFLLNPHGGLITVSVLLLYTLLVSLETKQKLRSKSVKPMVYLATFAAVVALVYIVLQKLGMFNIQLTIPYLLTVWNVDFLFKYNEFIYGNGILIIALFALSMAYTLIMRKERAILASLMASILLILYFSPVVWSYRVFSFLNPFMTVVMVFLLRGLLFNFERIKLKISIRKKSRALRLSSLVLICLLIIITPIIVQPVYIRFSYRNVLIPSNQPAQTYFTPAEYKATTFIKDNMGRNTIIVSDYFSMWLLTPLSNSVWIIDRVMETEEMSNNSLNTLRFIKDDVFHANSSESAFYAIHSLENRITPESEYHVNGLGMKNFTFIVIMSTRTSRWLALDALDLPYTQSPSIDTSAFTLFYNPKYFKLLTQVDGQVYIFEVLPVAFSS
jgi:hypothetical protein